MSLCSSDAGAVLREMKSAFVVPADDALEFGKAEGLSVGLQSGKEIVDSCPALGVELEIDDRWVVTKNKAEEAAGSSLPFCHRIKRDCGWGCRDSFRMA